MTETPQEDPRHIGDVLRETGFPTGDVADLDRALKNKSRDLASEVADLDEQVADAAAADREGLALDPAKISDLQRAHLEARIEQHDQPPSS